MNKDNRRIPYQTGALSAVDRMNLGEGGCIDLRQQVVRINEGVNNAPDPKTPKP